jgi:glutathione S-transferase
MQLLYTKRSPYARKVQVVALEKNLPLDLIEENLAQKSAALLQANPLAKIPALILDDGQALFDSPVICEYLDSLNATPILIAPNNRWQILRWQAVADGLMDSAVAQYLEKARHPHDFNAGFLAAQEHSCGVVLSYCERHSAELAALSLAGIAVACAVAYIDFRLPHLNPEGRYPVLQAWLNDYAQRPSFQATVPSN